MCPFPYSLLATVVKRFSRYKSENVEGYRRDLEGKQESDRLSPACSFTYKSIRFADMADVCAECSG